MSWAAQEFKDLKLGDGRRTERLIKLVDELSGQSTGSIPLAGGGWPETKAAYRLLDHPAVEGWEILEVHTTRTVERMQGRRWCSTFRTRPNWIAPRNQGLPGWVG